MLSFKEIISVSLILFSVIDIVGNIPIVIDLRKKAGHIQSAKATLVAGVIMVVTLFVGESILGLFGIDVESFAIAGAIIMFLIGMEMILERNIFKHGKLPHPPQYFGTARLYFEVGYNISGGGGGFPKCLGSETHLLSGCNDVLIPEILILYVLLSRIFLSRVVLSYVLLCYILLSYVVISAQRHRATANEE